MKEKMNVSEFARFIGVSHTAVQKAITAGKITGVTPDKKIITDIAIKEAEDWGLKKAPTMEDVQRLIQLYYSNVGDVLAFIAMDIDDLQRNMLSMADDKEMFYEAMDDRLSDYLAERREKLLTK
jgi:hypothetical protein